jgi:glycine betaine/proline transport system substrate-binding protein
MADKWPIAYKFLKNFQLDDEDQIPMMAAIDVKGEDLKAVVNAWVEQNQAKWKPMVDRAKM